VTSVKKWATTRWSIGASIQTSNKGVTSRNKCLEELIGGSRRVVIIAMRREKRRREEEKKRFIAMAGSNEAECASNTPEFNQDQMR
jgi:hypothetical protein